MSLKSDSSPDPDPDTNPDTNLALQLMSQLDLRGVQTSVLKTLQSVTVGISKFK